MTYWKSAAFKTLQKDWYERLEASGFQDAEEIVNGEFNLKRSAAYVIAGMAEVNRQARESYFRLLAELIQRHQFHNDVDRLILTMFSEGSKIKRISEYLAQHGFSRSRGTIRFKIRSYEMLWGLREYSPRELNWKHDGQKSKVLKVS